MARQHAHASRLSPPSRPPINFFWAISRVAQDSECIDRKLRRAEQLFPILTVRGVLQEERGLRRRALGSRDGRGGSRQEQSQGRQEGHSFVEVLLSLRLSRESRTAVLDHRVGRQSKPNTLLGSCVSFLLSDPEATAARVMGCRCVSEPMLSGWLRGPSFIPGVKTRLLASLFG